MLQDQERRLLSDQIQQTSVVLKELDQAPDPERASQFSVFVPVQMLNEIFKKADGLYFDPPEIKDARIVLESLRTNFDAGLPYVDFTVYACYRPNKPGTLCRDSTKVSLSTIAFVHIEPQSGGTVPDQALVSVEIVDVVPNIKVGIFQFSLRGFVKNLIQANLQKLISEKVPKAAIPLEASTHIAYSTGPLPLNIKTPRDDSYILGNMTAPSISRDVSARVTSAIFLKDGAHLFIAAQ